MNEQRLSQLYYLNREAEVILDKIERLKLRKQRLKQAIGDDEEIEKEIDYLAQTLRLKQKACMHERRILENFISSIADSQLRMILSLRYINGLSWQQVAFSIGEFDESYPRKRHKKFMKELEKNEN